MRRQLNTRISAVAAALALAAAMVLGAGERSEATGPTAEPLREGADGGDGDGTPGASGLRVYLDPETGELSSRPADPVGEPGSEHGRLDPHQRLNTYGGDLVQERLDQGGFKVDLRGRFQSAVVATIDPDTDEVSIDCVSLPATDESEATDDE